MTDQPPYSMSSLATILFGLSVLLDSGKCDDITIADVKAHAHAGNLIEFLTDKGGGIFASGFFHGREKGLFAMWFTNEIREYCEAMEGDERRKYGVEHRGICLLIVYTAEIIQHGKDLHLRMS